MFVLISDYGTSASDADIENMQQSMDVQRRGAEFITLGNWEGSTSAPTIKAGSRLDINGSLFEVQTSDIVIGSVPVSATNDLWIKLTVTGGTTVSADWSTTVPTWDAAKGGWYDGNDKFLPYQVDFDLTNWENKRELTDQSGNVFHGPTGGRSVSTGQYIERRIYEIGTWDMDATASANVTISLGTDERIVFMQAMIQSDSIGGLGAAYSPIDFTPISTSNPWGQITSTTGTPSSVTLQRTAGVGFDSTNYNSTSINRGYVVIDVIKIA